ncbi:3-deoxy-D-manno-octulosonate 8-phosphate phosphatase (KDO 8-P phosphatase) [Methylobacillus rhizosphaerae]|uniref:3-deoxy-D-manno-octulosonate 8-phosphate phosphatase KdsC n=1 Tax=Methylobacillus rhizosphaerae TaxID=551994 RepID=A0A238XQM0_9PROT|nr:HAD hydrolase family protein [Methylobacillus rhizosphaerae]SNR60644.1 3-deoxy-D-manno-octulosonate 8-phosphate phosphatase (KDO 8-P phosphatase) [Methylobacillus rhizosphaerae]
MISLEARAKRIKVAVFDVDGILTNGGLMLGDDGLEYKIFHSQDGLGMKMLSNTGVRLAYITGRKSNVVVKRAENTGVHILYQGVDDKLAAFNDLLEQQDVSAEECLFMGDDVIDIPPMRRAGLAITVPHAMPLVKEYAHYTTERQAGFGAVREVCEMLMKAQGTFDAQMAPYLK